MTQVELMDLTVVCHNFPQLPVPEIDRDNQLIAIEKILDGGTELVIVEGGEGIGKTTLLAQFAKKHPNNSVSLFIRPTRWGYELEYLKFDLCNQIEWAINQRELEEGVVDDAFLRVQFTKLQRLARRSTFYFLIDGLSEIPERDKQVDILNIVPFGRSGFRFIISKGSEDFSSNLKGVSYKSIVLPGFSLSDTKSYLQDLEIDRHLLHEIHYTCLGNPSYLATVRRILQSEVDPQFLFEEMNQKLPDLFNIEWRGVDPSDSEQLLILAALAYDHRIHTFDSLGRLLGFDSAKIRNNLANLSFVVFEDTEVKFVSVAFRKYAAEQLRHLRSTVYELRVENLLRDPESNEALVNLPTYLEEAGKLDVLLDYLSPDRWVRMLESGHSLGSIQQKTAIGINAARELHREGDLLRFSTQKSILEALNGVDVWRSEVEALLAVGAYPSALALAESSMLKEDQFHLLTIIAKARSEKGLQTEPEVLEQIRRLFEQIDKTSLGEQAFDIASELIYSDPSLAVELVEQATQSDEGEHALDWAFATLSATALVGAKNKQGLSHDTIESIRARIKSPEARKFSTAVSLLVGDRPAKEVIKELELLEKTSERLFLLGTWAVENREREDAVEAVEYGLRMINNTPSYTPNARDYRQLATPLPDVHDKAKVRELIKFFDGQKGNLQHRGPSEDYVRLQLLLARAESKYSYDNAYNRLTDVYVYTSTLNDLSIRAVCMARMFASISRLDDPEKRFRAAEVNLEAQKDLNLILQQLLTQTADHYLVSHGVIAALAKAKPEIALDLALGLNLESRRNSALADLVEASLRVPAEKLNLNFISRAIDKFTDLDLKDEAVLTALGRLASLDEKNDTLARQALPIINRIKHIRSPEMRCNACCLSYGFLITQNNEDYSQLVEHLIDMINQLWKTIDAGWQRVNVGFRIVETLAEYSPEISKRYLEQVEDLRGDFVLNASTAALTYEFALRLAIRALAGVIMRGVDKKSEDLDRLANLIDRIPSRAKRAELWAELAMRCDVNKQHDHCNQIVIQHVKPLIQNLSDDDPKQRAHTIIMVAPALYCAHSLTAIEEISKLSKSDQNNAFGIICTFILQKQPPTDPYDDTLSNGYEVGYEDLVEICDLLNRITLDSYLYHFIKCISDTLTSNKYSRNFTRVQKSDIATRLEILIKGKLPDKDNIKHNGFRIIAMAQVERIRRGSSKAWDELLEQARKIPNYSDQVFVLAIISTLITGQPPKMRKDILEEALKLAQNIPALIDQIDRLEVIADSANQIGEVAMAKRCTQLGMETALKINDTEVSPSLQRKLVDFAHNRFGSEYAASLLAIIDDDPATAASRARLRNRLELLDLKNHIADQKVTDEDLRLAKSECALAAWMNLGMLNAGYPPFKFEYMRKFVSVAAELPFNKAYPILAWVIESANHLFIHEAQANKYLRPIYEATLMCVEIVEKVANRSSNRLKQVKHYEKITEIEEAKVLIRAGEREKAVQVIRAWFENEVEDYLKICDQYFGPEDLSLLQLLLAVKPRCKVEILTSRKHQQNLKLSETLEDAYLNYWRLHISSSQTPPETDIVVVGTESGHSPIHDRWWLSKRSGLTLGTSYNSLGLNQTAEIVKLSVQDAAVKEAEMDKYLRREKKEHDNGEKLRYITFNL